MWAEFHPNLHDTGSGAGAEKIRAHPGTREDSDINKTARYRALKKAGSSRVRLGKRRRLGAVQLTLLKSKIHVPQ